jgi:8-oxo-dGTP diphosphatase
MPNPTPKDISDADFSDTHSIPANPIPADGDYSSGFARKVVASGMMILNEDRQVLLVNPTYKAVWEIPGGVVEAMEAPRDACIREVEEEIGIQIDPGRLLSVDYNVKPERNYDVLRFIFDGGILTKAQADAIVLQAEELSEFGFFNIEDAQKLLSRALGHQLSDILDTLDGEATVYAEHTS